MAKSTKKASAKKTRKPKNADEKRWLEVITLAEILKRRKLLMTLAGGVIGIGDGLLDGDGLFGSLLKGAFGAGVGYATSDLIDKLYELATKHPNLYKKVTGLLSKEEKEELAEATA